MSWEKKKLSDLCSITKGKIGITKAIPGNYPLVATSEERRSHNEYHFEGEAVVIPLVSSTGHGHRSLNRIHYQTGKFAVGSILCAVMPKDNTILNAEYLYRYLYLNKEKELVSRMRGMANVSLPMREIGKVEIPLPPLEKQLEFVEDYKKLVAVNGELSVEITRQISLVTQLRQAFLREAMQGKLVEQNLADEHASELLARVKAEKEQLIKEKKIRKQKPLRPIEEEEIPFEIPDSWEWCRLGNIADIKRGKSPKYSENGIFKMLNQKCVRWFYIETEHSKAINKEWYNNLDSSLIIQIDDLLVNSTGDGTIGRSAIAGIESLDYTFDSHVLRVRSYIDINHKLLSSIINSKYGQDLIESIKGATSTKQTELGVKNLSNFPIPIPPIFEQKRIVGKLDELMTYCDQLEESIKNSQRQNEMLLGQVLREALEPEEVFIDREQEC